MEQLQPQVPASQLSITSPQPELLLYPGQNPTPTSKPQGLNLVRIIVVAGFTKTNSCPSIKYKYFFYNKSFFS